MVAAAGNPRGRPAPGAACHRPWSGFIPGREGPSRPRPDALWEPCGARPVPRLLPGPERAQRRPGGSSEPQAPMGPRPSSPLDATWGRAGGLTRGDPGARTGLHLGVAAGYVLEPSRASGPVSVGAQAPRSPGLQGPVQALVRPPGKPGEALGLSRTPSWFRGIDPTPQCRSRRVAFPPGRGRLSAWPGNCRNPCCADHGKDKKHGRLTAIG